MFCHLASGLGAGFFAVICGSPVDVVKSRMMGEAGGSLGRAGAGRGVRGAWVGEVDAGGWVAWGGAHAPCPVHSPAAAAWTAATRHRLPGQHCSLPTHGNAAGGRRLGRAWAGWQWLAALLMSHCCCRPGSRCCYCPAPVPCAPPGPPSPPGAPLGTYSGMLDCFVKTFSRDGILAFYNGFGPNFARLGSWNGEATGVSAWVLLLLLGCLHGCCCWHTRCTAGLMNGGQTQRGPSPATPTTSHALPGAVIMFLTLEQAKKRLFAEH